MEILKIVLTILFVIDGIALINHCTSSGRESPQGLVRSQGGAETYWGQNKGRSMEGALVKSTKFLACLFMILAAALNLGVFN